MNYEPELKGFVTSGLISLDCYNICLEKIKNDEYKKRGNFIFVYFSLNEKEHIIRLKNSL